MRPTLSMPANYEYHIFKFDGKTTCALWMTDDDDGFYFVDGALLASDLADMKSYVRDHHFTVHHLHEEHPVTYDIDALIAACNEARPEQMGFAFVRNAWNIFMDLNRSCPHPSRALTDADRDLHDLHQRMTIRFDPDMSESERERLISLLRHGVALLKRCLDNGTAA